jgi:hypothetical protein
VAPKEEVKAVEVAPKVVVTKSGTVYKISSPYCKAFLLELKSEVEQASCWQDRRWNASEKVWEVNEAHKSLVEALVAKHYGEQVSL